MRSSLSEVIHTDSAQLFPTHGQHREARTTANFERSNNGLPLAVPAATTIVTVFVLVAKGETRVTPSGSPSAWPLQSRDSTHHRSIPRAIHFSKDNYQRPTKSITFRRCSKAEQTPRAISTDSHVRLKPKGGRTYLLKCRSNGLTFGEKTPGSGSRCPSGLGTRATKIKTVRTPSTRQASASYPRYLPRAGFLPFLEKPHRGFPRQRTPDSPSAKAEF